MQDGADATILVLTPEYVAEESRFCRYEMQRAVQKQRAAPSVKALPLVREQCQMPEDLFTSNPLDNPLYVDLIDDDRDTSWRKLLEFCDVCPQVAVSKVLKTLSDVVREMESGHSTNLALASDVNRRVIYEVLQGALPQLHRVDLQSGKTATRRGLIREILQLPPSEREAFEKQNDLEILHETIAQRSHPTLLALTHAEIMLREDKHSEYTCSFYECLTHLCSEGKLSLLFESRGRMIPGVLARCSDFDPGTVFSEITL